MARRAAITRAVELGDIKWVCTKCLEDNPSDKSLLSAICLMRNVHWPCHKTAVWWRAEKNHLEIYDERMPGRIPPIRPMPLTRYKGKFWLCDPTRCRGYHCKFAHSIEEREVWNATKFPPEIVHIRNVPSIREQPKEKGIGVQTQPKETKIPPIPQEVLKEELTPDNYRQRFLALIDCEREAHVQELRRKCDGEYKLVIDIGVKSMMNSQESACSNLCGYLVGLDGDQIAYCTQASEAIKLQCYGWGSCRAEILRVNNRRFDNKLYICIVTGSVNFVKEVAVTASFDVKSSYFDRLCHSINHLSKNTDLVQRLQPKCKDFELYARETVSSQRHLAFNLGLCSKDQSEALIAAISSPARGPPFLISGPFGSGKTRILALVSHYLFFNHDECTRILVCAQQHVSADTFHQCYSDLTEKKDDDLCIIRVVPDYFYGKPNIEYTKLHQLNSVKNNIPRRKKVLIITTCSTAYSMFQHKNLPTGYFTHILIDEAAQMREPEAVGPLCFASVDTKVILAGDQHQVGPALLVLGKPAREHGLAVSLMERLHHLYTETIKGEALRYHIALTTSHRCAREIGNLAEKLFYKTALKPSLESHPNAPFPLHFVCSSVENKLQPLETSVTYPDEAEVVVEQVRKWTAEWSKNVWGKKDFTEIAIASPTRSQVYEIGKLLKDGFAEKYQDVQKSPTYDMQGKDYRVVILSTSEPTNADGSARDQTKSICNPFVFNTVISRARSLIVCVGNPYVLLRKEQHMVREYGEKAKCWSNFLKLCFDNKTFSVGPPIQSTEEEVEWMCSPLPSIVDHFIGIQEPEELADIKG